MKALIGILAVATASAALAAVPPRPAITGISHIAVYAAAPSKSEHYYVHDLGAVQGADPENPKGVRYYFSSTQFVEVLPLPPGPASINRLDHVAFTTQDVQALRACLVASSVEVTQAMHRGSDDSQWLDVTDPEGNRIEFVQLPPGERARWKAVFDYLIFQTEAPALEHLPQEVRGLFGELTEPNADRIRAMLIKSLSRR